MSEKTPKASKKKTCSDHLDEDLKFYCTTHNDIICSICAVKRHKTCQDTLTFPEAIERFDRERSNLFKALDNQSKILNQTADEKKEVLRTLSPEAMQIKFKLRNLRSTLNRLIDKSESELLQKTEEVEKQQCSILAEDIQTLQNLSSAAVRVKQKAEGAFGKRAAFSIIKAMVKVQNAYCEIERSAKEAIDRPNADISLEISQSVQEFIDNFECLGTVSTEANPNVTENGTDASSTDAQATLGFLSLGLTSRENTSGESSTSGTSGSGPSRLPSSLDDIESSSEDESNPSSDDILTSGDDNDITIEKLNLTRSEDACDGNLPQPLGGAEAMPLSDSAGQSIKEGKLVASLTTADHGKPCWLYGITYMPDERLIITDVSHDSVQMYDKACSLLKETQVSFTPWDVVATSRNTIAICTGGKATINTFSVHNNDFVLLKSLDVGSDCISLAHSNNIFTAGTRNGGVLITEDGEIISRIEKNNNSKEVFRTADFLAVDDESRNIFISNAWASKIVCVTPDGRKLWETQTKGSNPRGLLWHNGRLIVASRNQHKIISVGNEGAFAEDIVQEHLEYPYAITLHPVCKYLAVTQWDEKMASEKTRTVKLFAFK